MEHVKHLSDNELTDLLRSGSRDAFTEIYKRYWSLIYCHMYKMLRDKASTEDAVQEIFSKLWLKREEINADANLKGYLYVNARNRVFNLIEQRKVRQDYLTAISSYLSEVNLDTLQQLDERQLADALDLEVSLLPAKMREIFELSRKGNLSHKEIAEHLDISDHTVKKQIQNALKILKPRLRDAGFSIALIIFSR